MMRYKTYYNRHGWKSYDTSEVGHEGEFDLDTTKELEVPDGGAIAIEVAPSRWLFFSHSEWASLTVVSDPDMEATK